MERYLKLNPLTAGQIVMPDLHSTLIELDIAFFVNYDFFKRRHTKLSRQAYREITKLGKYIFMRRKYGVIGDFGGSLQNQMPTGGSFNVLLFGFHFGKAAAKLF